MKFRPFISDWLKKVCNKIKQSADIHNSTVGCAAWAQSQTIQFLFHFLTNHKPLHFHRFCFIPPLQILQKTTYMKNNRFHKTTDFKNNTFQKKMHLKVATSLIRKQTLKNNRSQNNFQKSDIPTSITDVVVWSQITDVVV